MLANEHGQSCLNLLVDGVVARIGSEVVHARLAQLSGRYEAFVGFQARGGGGREGVDRKKDPPTVPDQVLG